MELIDSHAHLDFPQFDADRAAIIERARAAGVVALLAIGTGPGPEKLDAAFPLPRNTTGYGRGLASIHTKLRRLRMRIWRRLKTLAKHPRVIAWGEIGLDYHYDFSPREMQHVIFRRQLALARGAKLPVVIHCRDAWSDCLAMLRARLARLRAGRNISLFHRYTRRSARGAGNGIHDFLCGKQHVSQSRRICAMWPGNFRCRSPAD